MTLKSTQFEQIKKSPIIWALNKSMETFLFEQIFRSPIKTNKHCQLKQKQRSRQSGAQKKFFGIFIETENFYNFSFSFFFIFFIFHLSVSKFWPPRVWPLKNQHPPQDLWVLSFMAPFQFQPFLPIHFQRLFQLI